MSFLLDLKKFHEQMAIIAEITQDSKRKMEELENASKKMMVRLAISGLDADEIIEWMNNVEKDSSN